MKIYDAADFGRAVRTFRKAKGYTQQQIADLSGCSLMFVSNLERGKETAELGKARRRERWREMRLGIGVEFDDGLSRADYCHGLVCWRKETTRGRRTGRFC